MFRWQTWTGAAIGVVMGLAILTLAGGSASRTAPSGPILSECDGHFRELVIHYEPSAKEMVGLPYREFLGALEKDVTVQVVCPSRSAFEELIAIAGPVRCRFSPVVVRHPMTTWARDRWVALAPAAANQATTLWSPRGEAAEEVWPARAGDERVGQDLGAALTPRVCARRSEFYFDGGDFLADNENVFVVPRVLQRNIQHTVYTREAFLQALSRELKRRVILLDESPDHHAAMFMSSIGNHTMLVGDPSLVKTCLGPSGGASVSTCLPGGADFSAETQRLFDAVAAQSAAAGYKVIRIPTVPAQDGRSYLTYVNVLIDQQGSRRIVYLPFYRGVEPLNAAARAVWEQLGYEVRPVDCSSTYRHFGCLHCLVNVLKRD